LQSGTIRAALLTQSGTFGNTGAPLFRSSTSGIAELDQHGKHGKLDDELLRYARRFLVQPSILPSRPARVGMARNEPDKQERLGSECVLVKSDT